MYNGLIWLSQSESRFLPLCLRVPLLTRSGGRDVMNWLGGGPVIWEPWWPAVHLHFVSVFYYVGQINCINTTLRSDFSASLHFVKEQCEMQVTHYLHRTRAEPLSLTSLSLFFTGWIKLRIVCKEMQQNPLMGHPPLQAIYFHIANVQKKKENCPGIQH